MKLSDLDNYFHKENYIIGARGVITNGDYEILSEFTKIQIEESIVKWIYRFIQYLDTIPELKNGDHYIYHVAKGYVNEEYKPFMGKTMNSPTENLGVNIVEDGVTHIMKGENSDLQVTSNLYRTATDNGTFSAYVKKSPQMYLMPDSKLLNIQGDNNISSADVVVTRFGEKYLPVGKLINNTKRITLHPSVTTVVIAHEWGTIEIPYNGEVRGPTGNYVSTNGVIQVTDLGFVIGVYTTDMTLKGFAALTTSLVGVDVNYDDATNPSTDAIKYWDMPKVLVNNISYQRDAKHRVIDKDADDFKLYFFEPKDGYGNNSTDLYTYYSKTGVYNERQRELYDNTFLQQPRWWCMNDMPQHYLDFEAAAQLAIGKVMIRTATESPGASGGLVLLDGPWTDSPRTFISYNSAYDLLFNEGIIPDISVPDRLPGIPAIDFAEADIARETTLRPYINDKGQPIFNALDIEKAPLQVGIDNYNTDWKMLNAVNVTHTDVAPIRPGTSQNYSRSIPYKREGYRYSTLDKVITVVGDEVKVKSSNGYEQISYTGNKAVILPKLQRKEAPVGAPAIVTNSYKKIILALDTTSPTTTSVPFPVEGKLAFVAVGATGSAAYSPYTTMTKPTNQSLTTKTRHVSVTREMETRAINSEFNNVELNSVIGVSRSKEIVYAGYQDEVGTNPHAATQMELATNGQYFSNPFVTATNINDPATTNLYYNNLTPGTIITNPHLPQGGGDGLYHHIGVIALNGVDSVLGLFSQRLPDTDVDQGLYSVDSITGLSNNKYLTIRDAGNVTLGTSIGFTTLRSGDVNTLAIQRVRVAINAIPILRHIGDVIAKSPVDYALVGLTSRIDETKVSGIKQNTNIYIEALVDSTIDLGTSQVTGVYDINMAKRYMAIAPYNKGVQTILPYKNVSGTIVETTFRIVEMHRYGDNAEALFLDSPTSVPDTFYGNVAGEVFDITSLNLESIPHRLIETYSPNFVDQTTGDYFGLARFSIPEINPIYVPSNPYMLTHREGNITTVTAKANVPLEMVYNQYDSSSENGSVYTPIVYWGYGFNGITDTIKIALCVNPDIRDFGIKYIGLFRPRPTVSIIDMLPYDYNKHAIHFEDGEVWLMDSSIYWNHSSVYGNLHAPAGDNYTWSVNNVSYYEGWKMSANLPTGNVQRAFTNIHRMVQTHNDVNLITYNDKVISVKFPNEKVSEINA